MALRRDSLQPRELGRRAALAGGYAIGAGCSCSGTLGGSRCIESSGVPTIKAVLGGGAYQDRVVALGLHIYISKGYASCRRPLDADSGLLSSRLAA